MDTYLKRLELLEGYRVLFQNAIIQDFTGEISATFISFLFTLAIKCHYSSTSQNNFLATL